MTLPILLGVVILAGLLWVLVDLLQPPSFFNTVAKIIIVVMAIVYLWARLPGL